MNFDQIANTTVRAALEAMDAGQRDAWLALFAPNATLTDDGNAANFVTWSDSEIFGRGHGRLTTIDKVEENGTAVYGRFHSAQWGTFKTFFKFHVDSNKITRLDVGQADD